MMKSRTAGILTAACLLSFAATPVLAQNDEKVEPSPTPVATSSLLEASPKGLSSDELAGLSGGDGGVALAVSTQNATNTGNQINANSVTTGGINVSQDAFSSFSGLGNIIMNTGNNNNIQTSMSVSIVMPPR